jgi:4-amino-4-deoxy-L-arabinose transferase-like glycosyltransferase
VLNDVLGHVVKGESMRVVLPFLAFVFLSMGFRRKRTSWRASLLFASIPWALFLAFITEALTQFRFLTRTGVALSWFGFAVLCFLWMKRTTHVPETAASADTENMPLSRIDRTALGLIAVLLALIALTALASAPNNWDAMEYHLPRVVEWMNNRGVQFFPTLDWFQLQQPPFAEYTMLHLHLLYGSDRMVALAQWLADLGCIIGATLVAKELGGSRRSQIVTAVFAATIPSAVLGASSTKNDCVLAYWIVLIVYLLLRWRRSQNWPHALAIGAALGLAAFTKGTSYLLLPCLVLACALMWNGTAKRRFLLYLPIITAMGILVCAQLWVRNYQYTGSPLGLPYFRGVGSVNTRMFRNTYFTPAQIAADVARNVALNVGVPSDRINTFSTRAFSRFMWKMGVNPNEPGQLSWRQSGEALPFKVAFDPRDEFFSEDSVHLLLFLLAGALCIFYWRRTGRELSWFGLGLVGSFVLYCAFLRWAPTNERYLLPIVFLGAAFTAVVLVRILPKIAVSLIVGLLLLVALPLALVNETRPLITRNGLRGSILTTPRNETYFFDRHREIAASFISAATAARASGCRTIGLDANLLHFEYPMMAMLGQDGVSRQIRYVGVENSSVRYAQPSAQPVCMVICLHCLDDPEKIAEYSAKLPKTQSFGTMLLFGQ